MNLTKIKILIKEELKTYFKDNDYSLKDELIMENEILIGELLDPENSYQYEGEKGFYTYKDSNGITFFVRLTYLPEPHNYFEFKTGWVDKNNKPQYEPISPPNSAKSSVLYIFKRSDTVAKIWRDEILPFFEKQNISNTLVIKPISSSRMKFAERLVKKFTPVEKFNIEYGSPLIITKNEKIRT